MQHSNHTASRIDRDYSYFSRHPAEGSPNPTLEIRVERLLRHQQRSAAQVFPHLAATLFDSLFHENIKNRASS
jgi:hypothetical protein